MPAQAAEQVSTYVVNATVNADGSLWSKPRSPSTVPRRPHHQALSTRVRTADNLEYRFKVSGITVTTNGQPLAATLSETADAITITVPTAQVTTPIEIAYTVPQGAALPTAGDTTTVAWGLLQGLSVPVATFDATVGVPALFESVDCAAGDVSSPGTCVYYGGGTHDSPNPFFHDENRAAGEVVVATLRFRAARWL